MKTRLALFLGTLVAAGGLATSAHATVDPGGGGYLISKIRVAGTNTCQYNYYNPGGSPAYWSRYAPC